MKLDIAITGGKVYDGTGEPPVEKAVGISGEKIVFPLDDDLAKSAGRIIDACGMAVSPGFINIHSHSEEPFIIDGRVPSSLCQGITTEVAGNCGTSAAPMAGEVYEYNKKELKREYDLDLDWEDFNGFFRRVEEKGSSINLATLIGQGTLRGSVVGMKDRPATAEEISRMKEWAVELMNQGAWGISTGLIYPPSSYASFEELVEISGTVGECGGLYSSHIRGEGDRLVPAIREALDIGRQAEIRVEISHLKAAGINNWGKVKTALEMIREARNSGLRVQHDQYPYIMSATGLDAILPEWLHDGGKEKFLKRLRNPEIREKVKGEMNKDFYSDGNRVIIAHVAKEENVRMEGKKADRLAREAGKDPLDFIIDLLLDEDGTVGAIYLSMCEDDVRMVMSDPYTSVCTDAWPRAVDGPLRKGKPHPRTYGSFPRVLGHYRREEKLFTLEEAIRKMTSLPASMLGLTDRGIISDGLAADLIIFDPETIRDTSTIQDPHQYPEGIKYIIVNGRPAFDDGEIMPIRPGKVLRRGKAV